MSRLFLDHVSRARRAARKGFTLVEILVAAAITVILVGILLSITNLTGNAIKQASSTLTTFSTARTAFDVITQKLSQATLNTYLDYFDAAGNQRSAEMASINAGNPFIPASYGRASDLQFYIRQNLMGKCGEEVYFQTPQAYAVPDGTDAQPVQSVQGLLNACGFYVAYGDSALFQPSAVVAHRYRYRLMQAMEPTESLSIFSGTPTPYFVNTAGTNDSTSWLQNIRNTATGPLKGSEYVSPLADNVIALVVWPRLSAQDDPAGTSLSTDYTYNSQDPTAVKPLLHGVYYTQGQTANQLPPTVELSMIVVDEASVVRLYGPAGQTAPNGILEQALKPATPPVPFTLITNYSQDVSNMVSVLAANHINFQVFDATVALRESKWSQNPTQ